jgi:hypothetical protein
VKPRTRTAVVALALAVVAVAFWQSRMVAAVRMPQKVVLWSSYLYEVYLPAWTLAYHGPTLLPRWNPWQLAGLPFLASPTSGLLYPLNLVATLLPVPKALGWLSAAHLALAGVLTFACGRALGLSRAASSFGAVAFILSERVLSERIHTLYLFGISWIPGVLLFAGRVASAPSVRAGMLLGAAMAAQLLTGYPEIACFTAYTLVVLAGARVLLAPRSLPPLGRTGLALAVAAATVVGLAAAQILPALELMQRGGRGATRLPLADVMVLPPPSFADVLRTSGWLLPLALVASTDRRRIVTVGTAVVALAFVWLVGLGTPFYTRVFYYLPAVGLFRLPQAILPIGELVLALLAALGLQRALDGERRVLAGMLLLAGGAVLLVAGIRYEVPAVFAAGVLAFVPSRSWRAVATWAVVGATLLGRWAQPGSIIMMPQNNDATFFDPPPVVEFLRERVGIDRVLVIKNWRDRFPITEKMGTLHRFPAAQDFDQLTPADYRRFLAPLKDSFLEPYFAGRYFPTPFHPGWTRLDLLGVRWVVVAPGSPWAGDRSGRFRLAYDGPDARVFENLRSRPRAFLVQQWTVAGDAETMLAKLDAAGFDPAAEVVLDREPELRSLPGAAAGPVAVRIEQYAEEEVRLAIETPRNAILVLTDLYWPGWRVEVDDVERPLNRADLLFRAVALEAGAHRVRFRYEPASNWLGALIATITATVVVATLASGAWSGDRRRERATP